MIGVIGGGQMGAGIAELVATHNINALIVEVSDTAANASLARITASLERAVARGKVSADDAAAAVRRIRVDTDWSGLAEADCIIEAVPEDPHAKAAVYARLDNVAAADALLATNTSSLPIAQIAAMSARPAQVIGLHFFNPVPVMGVVEVITGIRTSEQSLQRALALAATLERTVIRSADRAGFIVNGLLMPYLFSAIRMLEAGHATADDIDAGMVLGCAHPMGPLRLADFIGLDTCQAIGESLFAEYREPQFAPPALLRRMVESGLLGRKSARGFYSY